MIFYRLIFLCICFFSFNFAEAGQFSERNFDQNRMIGTSFSVMILSPCEEEDHITSYTTSGGFLWDLKVNTKVMSWNLKDGFLFIFSKSRYLEKTYLTCIDPATGKIVWERP